MNDDKNSPTDKIVGSGDGLERDRMWCRAITAMQKVDTSTGRLILTDAYNRAEAGNDYF